jgi:hypothetical protein
MKPLALVGSVLVVLGAFVVFRGASFGSRRNVVDVGDLQVSTSTQQVIPPWIGGVAMIGGVVLIIGGLTRRNA